MENKSKTNTVLLVIIIILLVVFGGIYFLKEKNSIKNENTGICGENGEFCPGTPGYEERIKREKIVETSSQEDTGLLIEKIYKNINSYENKKVVLDGYIFGLDIKSETEKGNQHLTLRDSSSLEKNNNISMKILSQDIKNTLINKYKYNSSQPEWVHVEISGTVKSISLPMNGTVGNSAYVEVDSLVLK